MALIAVCGRKGGVGKSTIAANLATELVALGLRVKVLDADPQQSLVAWAGLGDGMLSRMVEPARTGTSRRFRAQVAEALSRHDRVILDTPPSLGRGTLLALLLAHAAILPCGPSPLDLLALDQMVEICHKARRARRGAGPRVFLVPSRNVANTKLGRELKAVLAEVGEPVLPGVTMRIAVAESAVSGLTTREFAPGSPAQKEFARLARALEQALTAPVS